MDTRASNRSMSTITTVTLSHAQSYTYPLTRMSNCATTLPSPSASSKSTRFLPAKLTRRSRTQQHKPFHIEMSDLTHTSPFKQSPSQPTDADYDGDAEDNGAECANVDLVTLVLCTVDSMEIIRRDTEEKWKGGRSRSGSASTRGSVMGGVKRAVVKVKTSVRNGIRGLVKKFTF